MSLVTYADLLTQMGNYLQRSDITSMYPDFVVLFEANANQKLRTRLQTVVLQGTTTNGVLALPTDYQALSRVTWVGDTRRDLEYIDPVMLAYNYPTNSQGPSQVYSIEGTSMLVRPTDDTTPIEFAYTQAIGPLSAGTNWLWKGYPNLYLFGSLVEAQAFAVDPDKGAMWQTRRDEIYDDILKLDFRHLAGPSIKVHGPTP
jgi:hypothetical protein